MLAKVRDMASIPDGLMKAKVDLKRGMIVCRKLEDGEYKITLPSDTNGTDVYGFVTLREDESIYARSYYDEIKAGKRAVVYTLVKDNEWATDQIKEGEFASLAVGDKMYANTDGTLGKVSSGETALFECIGKRKALAGYEKDTVIVKVL